MQDNLKKLLKKEMTRKNFLHLFAIGIIGILGFGGVISFLLAHASTPAVSEEAEDGTLNSNATTGNDTNASGSEYVKFGTAPSGGSSPVPMMSQYSSYVLAPGGDFEFAQMESSSGQLPTGPWELSPSYQIGSNSLLSNVSIEHGTGLILQVSDSSGSGVCIDTLPTTSPGGGWSLQAPYYREISVIIPGDGTQVNHSCSWALATRQGDDSIICGEIDIDETGWGQVQFTLSTSSTSQYQSPQTNMGLLNGSHWFGIYVAPDNASVTLYLDGNEQSTTPFPANIGTPPADAQWYPLHDIQGGDGVAGAIDATVIGAAGQYVVAYDRWFVPG